MLTSTPTADRLREERSSLPDGHDGTPRDAAPEAKRYTGEASRFRQTGRVTTDAATLRLALVEDLCRRGVIRTPAVREAFVCVPRERFVPGIAEERGLAAVYEDSALSR